MANLSSVKVAIYISKGELFSGESLSLLFSSVSFAKRKVGRLILEGRIWRLSVGGGGNDGKTFVFFSSVLIIVVTRFGVVVFMVTRSFEMAPIFAVSETATGRT